MTLFIATSNANKIQEFKAILGNSWQIKSNLDFPLIDEVDEPYQTLEENAKHKAKSFYDATGLACIAEDTGLEILSLNGSPGVRSARFAGEERSSEKNMALVLEKLKDEKRREARFRTVISLYSNKEEVQFEGVINGIISHEPMGTKGFGYDPIFIPEGYSISFAQMESLLKNKISHRAMAMNELIQYLKKKTG